MSIKDIFNEYLLLGFDEVKKYKSLLKISEEKLSNLLVDYYLNELCVEEKLRVIKIIKTFKVDDVVKNKIFEYEVFDFLLKNKSIEKTIEFSNNELNYYCTKGELKKIILKIYKKCDITLKNRFLSVLKNNEEINNFLNAFIEDIQVDNNFLKEIFLFYTSDSYSFHVVKIYAERLKLDIDYLLERLANYYLTLPENELKKNIDKKLKNTKSKTEIIKYNIKITDLYFYYLKNKSIDETEEYACKKYNTIKNKSEILNGMFKVYERETPENKKHFLYALLNDDKNKTCIFNLIEELSDNYDMLNFYEYITNFFDMKIYGNENIREFDIFDLFLNKNFDITIFKKIFSKKLSTEAKKKYMELFFREGIDITKGDLTSSKTIEEKLLKTKLAIKNKEEDIIIDLETNKLIIEFLKDNNIPVNYTFFKKALVRIVRLNEMQNFSGKFSYRTKGDMERKILPIYV